MARNPQAANGAATDKVEQIDVVILDREFRLAVKHSERPQLLAAVQMVDERMRAVRDGGRISGMDRIAVMAALRIAHELVELRDADGKSGSGLGDSLRKIRRMNDQVEAELKRQESLF